MEFRILLFSLLAVFFGFSYEVERKKRDGYIHTVSDEEYELLLAITKGDFSKPVNERSRQEKSVIIKFWRNKDSYSVDADNNLLYQGKKVVKKSSISKFVSKTFDNNKSGGVKKLRLRAANSLAGLSEKQILGITNVEKKYRIFNAKFLNKPTPRAVLVKDVQTQHQIDLVNLSNMKVTYRGKTFRYILSLMDVFSRYHWLRPLESKHPSAIAHHLNEIYSEHGPPNVLQSDRGSKFKKEVKHLCKRLKILMIQSRPYHPQSQGKIERSHKEIRRKIEYDLLKLKRRGVNWAGQLWATIKLSFKRT